MSTLYPQTRVQPQAGTPGAEPDTGGPPADAEPLGSRAVTRWIEPGSMMLCVHCDERVKFVARMGRLQVIVNVYVDGRWTRVEHYHADCYDDAGAPYGRPSALASSRSTRRLRPNN